MRADTFRKGTFTMILENVQCEVTGLLLKHVDGLAAHNDGTDWRLIHTASGYMLGSGPTSDVVADMADAIADLADWTQPLLSIVQDIQALEMASYRIRRAWQLDWERRAVKDQEAKVRAKAKPKKAAPRKGAAEERQADVTTREAA